MKLCGLITEYNPFHNGHLYHLDKSRELVGADAVVAVMSGHFLQRGEPAIMDKWTRAQLAVEAGVDLVIELPTYFATSSAEGFALGAVALLERLGVDSFVFGSESGDIHGLDQMAAVIDAPGPIYREALEMALGRGDSYHVARQVALEAHLLSEEIEVPADFKANNILGIEYLRAARALNARIAPQTIKRIANDYSDTQITSNIASATAVRAQLKNRPINWDQVGQVLPKTTFDGLFAYPVYTELDDFQTLFNAIALREGAKGLSRLRDMAEGLEHKFLSELSAVGTLSDMALNVKSKRYTLTRIQRLIIATLLAIEPIPREDALKHLDYARVLAFNPRGAKALREIKTRSDLSIFTNMARDLKKYRRQNPLIDLDILATGIYAQVNHTVAMNEDYTRKPYGAV